MGCVARIRRAAPVLLAGGLLLPTPESGTAQGVPAPSPQPTASQGTRPRPVPSPLESAEAGWLGILYMGDGTSPTLRLPDGTTALWVSALAEGSPALQAGLRRGDLILRINGNPVTEEGFRPLQLRRGDPVRLSFLRDGRMQELTLRAGARPGSALPLLEEARVDSLRLRILEDMETFLASTPSRESRSIVTLYRMSPSEGDPSAAAMVQVTTRTTGMGRAAPGGSSERQASGAPANAPGSSVTFRALPGSVPFGYFAVHRDRSDSLEAAVAEVRGALSALAGREVEVRHLLAARTPPGGGAHLSEATTRAALQADHARLLQDRTILLELQSRLQRELASSRQAGFQGGEGTPRPAAAPPGRAGPPPTARDRSTVASGLSGAPPPEAAFRPLAVHLLGERVVAGAELVPLNPQLAEYFQGEEGLLVIQVVQGSPAWEGGIQPGDVILRVGTRPVRTVEQLRAALDSRSGASPELTLVRRGRTLVTSLPVGRNE